MMLGTKALAGYEQAADSLLPAFDRIDPAELYATVAGFFPPPPATAIDIGAGSGRDAAWLARSGYDVVAVEPVAAFRDHGRRACEGLPVRWLADRLPDLASVRREARSVRLAIASAVWQHLEPEAQIRAIGSLAAILETGGRAVVSLRRGPGASSRPVFPCNEHALVDAAARSDVRLVHDAERPSMQEGTRARGVTWTWLVLERVPA
jgi:SAM-dependent methyltransferase